MTVILARAIEFGLRPGKQIGTLFDEFKEELLNSDNGLALDSPFPSSTNRLDFMFDKQAWIQKKIEEKNRWKESLPVVDVYYGESNNVSWSARIRVTPSKLKFVKRMGGVLV